MLTFSEIQHSVPVRNCRYQLRTRNPSERTDRLQSFTLSEIDLFLLANAHTLGKPSTYLF